MILYQLWHREISAATRCLASGFLFFREDLVSKRLYVGNVPYKATEDDLRELFSKAGEVVSVKLLSDTSTGKMRGFGFVEMSTEAQAKKAIEMFNGISFMQRNIVVNEAKPQTKRPHRRD